MSSEQTQPPSKVKTILLIVMVFVSLVFFVFGFIQKKDADYQREKAIALQQEAETAKNDALKARDEAETQRKLASEAQAEAEKQRVAALDCGKGKKK